MNDRDYGTMAWYEAGQMVHRAWLHLVNQDELKDGYSREARRILREAGSRILYDDVIPATSDEVAVLRAVASAEGVTL